MLCRFIKKEKCIYAEKYLPHSLLRTRDDFFAVAQCAQVASAQSSFSPRPLLAVPRLVSTRNFEPGVTIVRDKFDQSFQHSRQDYLAFIRGLYFRGRRYSRARMLIPQRATPSLLIWIFNSRNTYGIPRAQHLLIQSFRQKCSLCIHICMKRRLLRHGRFTKRPGFL